MKKNDKRIEGKLSMMKDKVNQKFVKNLVSTIKAGVNLPSTRFFPTNFGVKPKEPKTFKISQLTKYSTTL